MNKKILCILFLIMLTVIVFFFLLKDNYTDIINSIINAKFSYLLLAIIFYAIYTILQSIPFYTLSKIHKHEINFSFYVYLVTVTNFFNGITPLATGGQPIQIYEIHKKGISTLNSTNITIENFIIFQLTIVIFGIISFIINSIFNFFTVSNVLNNLTIIGFLLNIFLLLIVIIMALNKGLILKLISLGIDILAKIKVIKNSQERKDKWDNTCTEFSNNFKILLQNKKIFLLNIFILLLAFFIYYTIPFIIIYALNISTNITLVITIMISSYVFLASSYLPIPGATGGMEYAFLGYFGNYITNYKLNSLLITWRVITYYLPMIIGGIVFNINSLKNKIK